MSIHNGLNDTEELPVIPPEFSEQPVQPSTQIYPSVPSFPQETPEYPENTLEYPANTPEMLSPDEDPSGVITHTGEFPKPYQSAPPVHPVTAGHPPRQPIRRASMIPQETPEEPSMPYRRPPQQKKKPVKREPAEQEPKPKRKKKKKRKSCLGKLIASLITFVLVIFTIYSVIAVAIAKKLQFQATETRHLEENSIVIQDDDVKNYLLIGTTSRDTERGKADSIHLISVSSHNHTFTFTTISPNCLINIPTHGDGLLKDAYTYGGPTLLMDTITNEFGIPVDQYICVGFHAFMNLADSLGGLEVKITEEQMKQINEILKEEVNSALKEVSEADLLQKSGDLILNGKQLLAYSHLKDAAGTGLSDIINQKNVWNGLLEKAQNMDFSTAKKIVKNAFPIVSTNMDTLQLFGLSLKLPYHLIRYDFQSFSLPAQGTFQKIKDSDGKDALTIDYDANLQSFRSVMTTPIVKQQ